MPNTYTNHSAGLRQETQTKRRNRVIAEGGMNLYVLLEQPEADKLRALLEHAGINKKELIERLIDKEYRLIPKK